MNPKRIEDPDDEEEFRPQTLPAQLRELAAKVRPSGMQSAIIGLVVWLTLFHFGTVAVYLSQLNSFQNSFLLDFLKFTNFFMYWFGEELFYAGQLQFLVWWIWPLNANRKAWHYLAMSGAYVVSFGSAIIPLAGQPDGSSLISLAMLLSTTLQLFILAATMRVIAPLISFFLIKSTSSQDVAIPSTQWSIRGIMLLTLLVAVYISSQRLYNGLEATQAFSAQISNVPFALWLMHAQYLLSLVISIGLLYTTAFAFVTLRWYVLLIAVIVAFATHWPATIAINNYIESRTQFGLYSGSAVQEILAYALTLVFHVFCFWLWKRAGFHVAEIFLGRNV